MYGWIKLFRDEQFTEKFRKKPFDDFHAYVWILFKADKSKMVKCSQSEMAEAFGWEKKDVSKFTQSLVESGKLVNETVPGAASTFRIPDHDAVSKEYRIPTLEQVKDFITAKRITTFSADAFFEYYQNRNWKIKGKTFDWKEVCEWWEKKNLRRKPRV